MAQLKIAPHLLLEALFGGCDIVTGLRINGATFDPKSGGTVLLDIEGPGVPEHGEVVAEITKARQSVRFLAVGGPAPSQPVTVGMDMASGPDMTCIAVPHTSEWSEVATITGDVGVTSRRIPLQRLQVKDTMSQATPGGAGYSFRVHECAGGGAAPGTGGGPAHGTNGKALELMGVTSPGLGTATLAPTCGAETAKFLADKLAGGPRAVTLLPEEADEDGHPKAMPANANLLKVR